VYQVLADRVPLPNSIDIDNFLDHPDDYCVVDVRSPSEFSSGHVPQAVNVPLFNDEERARVGTCFKRDGREAAVLMGLEIVGPKMRRLAEELLAIANGRQVVLHCWRGGMRSSSVAWLLEQMGIQPKILAGGYKSFRRKAHQTFELNRPMFVLSGMTGAGKTIMLHEIAALGEQVIDLESLANHRGSSFGGIGLPSQPSVEQFENDLFMKLHDLDPNRPIWLEDESPSIGKVRVPDSFWRQMRESPAIFLDVSRESRAKILVAEYGELDKSELRDAVSRLERKLGGLRAKQFCDFVDEENYYEVALGLLEYYDKTYQHAAKKRPRTHVFRLPGDSTADDIVAFSRTLNVSSASS